MKILTLDQFLECKIGTLYQEIYANAIRPGRLCIKGESLPNHEELQDSLGRIFVKFHDLGMPNYNYSDDLLQTQASSIEYSIPSAENEFDTTLYYKDTMFAVWSPSELRKFGVIIQKYIRSAAREPLVIHIDDREEEQMKWGVDEWLDKSLFKCAGNPELAYVHFFFTLHRFPAAEQSIHHPFTQQFELYADYENATWRVTGASRMGDVYLACDPKREMGYDRRVTLDFSKFSNWRAKLDGTETMAIPPKQSASETYRHQSKTSTPALSEKTSGRHYKKIDKKIDLPEGQYDIYIRTK